MKSVATSVKGMGGGREYPWIGVSTTRNGLIILFHEEDKGTVINDGDGSSSWKLGAYADN